jgi:hypothetical protein
MSDTTFGALMGGLGIIGFFALFMFGFLAGRTSAENDCQRFGGFTNHDRAYECRLKGK